MQTPHRKGPDDQEVWIQNPVDSSANHNTAQSIKMTFVNFIALQLFLQITLSKFH